MYALARRIGLVATLALAGSVLVPSSPADAANPYWRGPRPVPGPTVAAVLADGTTVLVSTGGKKKRTVFEQRRAPGGHYGERTPITRIAHGVYCSPVLVNAQQSTVGVSVRCQKPTGLEDPPGITVDLVWSDGAWSIQDGLAKSSPSSVDVSPDGEHVVFATDNEYFGTPEHVTSWAGGTFTDRTWDERGSWGDVLKAAVGNDGEPVVLRTTGFEDEPGFWIGGAVELLHYDAGLSTWVSDFLRKGHGIGVTDDTVDVSADGLILGSYVRHFGNREQLWAVRASDPTTPVLLSVTHRTGDIFGSGSGITADGTGVLAWQSKTPDKRVDTRYGFWPAGKPIPGTTRIELGGAPTTSIRFGNGVSVSTSAGGSVLLAWVTREADAKRTKVDALNFEEPRGPAVGRTVHGDLDATVTTSSGANGNGAVVIGEFESYTLGRKAALLYAISPF